MNLEPVICEGCGFIIGAVVEGQVPTIAYCHKCAAALGYLTQSIAPTKRGLAVHKLLTFADVDTYGYTKNRPSRSWYSLIDSIPNKKLTPESFSPLTFKQALHIVQPTTNAGKALLKRLENDAG